MIFKNFFSNKKQNNSDFEKKEFNLKIEPPQKEKKNNWFAKLKLKLKSSNFFFKNILNLFSKSEIDYLALEEMLLDFDIDFEIVSRLIEKIKSKNRWGAGLNPESAKTLIKEFMLEILKPHFKTFSLKENLDKCGMAVLIFCGINGAGKTTTIAKIASLYKNPNLNPENLKLKPLFVACDVFRAAASEQLDFWAKKLNFDIYFGHRNEKTNQSDECENIEKTKKIDPASVAFSGVEYAKTNGFDLVMIDTSGRLHNNSNLMAELSKINRVLKKHDENFANEVILVADGTMGQNLKDQFEMFDKTVKITGIIFTKLDGISKGGILLSLVDRFKVPVYFIGIGETEEDINFFDPEEFVESLFD